MGRFHSGVLGGAVLMLAMSACGLAQGDKSPQVPSAGPNRLVAPWERIVGAAYENKGIAQVERLGERWMLNVMCDGVHATYLDDTTIDLQQYSTGYVSARYHYVERAASNVRCVQAPCPPILERRIALETLSVLPASPEQARARALKCD